MFSFCADEIGYMGNYRILRIVTLLKYLYFRYQQMVYHYEINISRVYLFQTSTSSVSDISDRHFHN